MKVIGHRGKKKQKRRLPIDWVLELVEFVAEVIAEVIADAL